MNRRQLIVLCALAALPATARAGEGGKDKDKDKAGELSYIKLETLTAFTIKPNGRRGVMSVECGVDIPDPGLRARAQLLLPRLRAAFVDTVQIYAGGLPGGMPPDPDFLARNLQRSADEVLGRKGARVLMGAVLVN